MRVTGFMISGMRSMEFGEIVVAGFSGSDITREICEPGLSGGILEQNMADLPVFRNLDSPGAL